MLKNIGGMQRVSMQLAGEMEASPDVELHTLTQETGWKFIGLKTAFFMARLFLFLPSYVRKTDADVVLFSSMVTGTMAWFIGNRVKKPMITITHGHDVTMGLSPYQWFLRKVFRKLDGVISVSSATQQECINRGLSPERSQVLPNGFDIKDVEDVPDKPSAREFIAKEFNLDLNGKKLLLTVGRLIKRKGHEWFIREVLTQVETDAIYLVIGDGAENAAISQAVQDTGFQDKVYLAGRQPDEVLSAAYAAADLFIMPNIKVTGDMEGFGVVLLEANIRETPAIASDLEGIRDVIKQGENGYRIAENDKDAFAKKIDKTLTSGELKELSQKSRKYAMGKFNWQQVASDYIKYLATFVPAERNETDAR